MKTERFSFALISAALATPLAFAAPAEEGGHSASTGFGNLAYPFTDVATNFAFAAFVAFVLIAISLGALKAITSALDGRTVEIKRQLDESRQLREEAAAALADAERRQKEADQAAEDMIKQAKVDAKMMVEQARKDLAEKVARREAQAEARIARAEAEATNDVRRAAANAATRASKDIVSNSAKRGDLFTEALGEIEKALN
jgi:F-type H+-transporting ATPase subunit b